MVSPGGLSNGISSNPTVEAQTGPHQSADLREGFVNAYNIVTTVSTCKLQWISIIRSNINYILESLKFQVHYIYYIMSLGFRRYSMGSLSSSIY